MLVQGVGAGDGGRQALETAGVLERGCERPGFRWQGSNSAGRQETMSVEVKVSSVESRSSKQAPGVES